MSESNSQNFNMQDADPNNVQDLAALIQLTLQQMQTQFQTLSDQITNRNILFDILLLFKRVKRLSFTDLENLGYLRLCLSRRSAKVNLI
jgi:hypothetical protein